eukprot:CAMPEP_0174727158 /NCGR_PEP_ID=MMETSP1094-20130205/49214_1 /TAXON_ID=156173 /ORGANISM="Chrysochromulina brevifilum, Strain UTEX LB 985" /LENGTH=46 /DNA_ID= /DNA_START= /DNA_END= /DNA_ORIENTATION=
MKVLLGVGVICGIAYLPLATQGDKAVGFDTMEEKREAMKAAGRGAR